MPALRMSAAVNAVIDTGTFSMRSSRCRAVTTISSSAPSAGAA
jgi:hypothetical protein